MFQPGQGPGLGVAVVAALTHLDEVGGQRVVEFPGGAQCPGAVADLFVGGPFVVSQAVWDLGEEGELFHPADAWARCRAVDEPVLEVGGVRRQRQLVGDDQRCQHVGGSARDGVLLHHPRDEGGGPAAVPGGDPVLEALVADRFSRQQPHRELGEGRDQLRGGCLQAGQQHDEVHPELRGGGVAAELGEHLLHGPVEDAALLVAHRIDGRDDIVAPVRIRQEGDDAVEGPVRGHGIIVMAATDRNFRGTRAAGLFLSHPLVSRCASG